MLVLASVVCLNRNAAAQSAAPEKPTPIADTANGISRALWSTQADPAVQPNMPVFRANVTIDVWALPVPWHLTERPGPTNPRFNGYHQEHLMMTTPEAFRTSTFYPIGTGIESGDDRQRGKEGLARPADGEDPPADCRGARGAGAREQRSGRRRGRRRGGFTCAATVEAETRRCGYVVTLAVDNPPLVAQQGGGKPNHVRREVWHTT